MDLGLKDKVAIVTGGSEGIGRATVWRLAKEGAKVVTCARRRDVLENAVEAIRKETGGELLAVVADVQKPEDCKRVLDEALKRFGRVDILVNNAGRAAARGIMEVTDEEWKDDLDLKLIAAVRLSRLAIPEMRKVGGGRIVNLTHVGGKQPGASSLPSSVSRAAGIALTKALSKECASDNILVNTVCVGTIKSGQQARGHAQRAPEKTLDEYYKSLGGNVPLGRVGEAEEVGDLIAFLVSERGSYITGAAVNVDGGVSGVF